MDESVQVQVVEDAATGERLALILGRQRVIFPGGRWLEFRVVVDGPPYSWRGLAYSYPPGAGPWS
jgi:hypothetical protein